MFAFEAGFIKVGQTTLERKERQMKNHFKLMKRWGKGEACAEFGQHPNVGSSVVSRLRKKYGKKLVPYRRKPAENGDE